MGPSKDDAVCKGATDLIDLFRQQQINFGNSHRPLMRGERKCSYQPTAGIFRSELAATSETAIFNEFMQHVPAHSQIQPSDLWSVMTLAQHHGLPKRLLDWASNPLVALYFDCEQKSDEDAAVWIVWGFNDPQTMPANPADVDTILYATPLVISPRIQAQSGEFTIHPNGDPIESFLTEGDHILKITIPNDLRFRMLTQLDIMGINRKSLFPDLDRLAQYLRWRTDPKNLDVGLARN